MESVWVNIFLFDDIYVWENIYMEKIKKIFDKMCQNLIINYCIIL